LHYMQSHNKNGWSDPDAVWHHGSDGSTNEAGFGDRSTGRGTFGANLGRAIVNNGDFTAYVCDSASTRPSFQITLGKLVIIGDAVALMVEQRTCDLQVAGSSTGWAPLRSFFGQATYTRVPLLPSSIIWYRPMGRGGGEWWSLWLEK